MATMADKRFQQLSLAISKAINSQEMPVKEKHVRSSIIGSFQERGAVTYWVTAIRLPLQDNRIVAWKFCHVTHKLLREGHPACLDDSQRHVATVENLGKLWVHLREGYGKLISLYTLLLAGKLKFHARNPQFPGNMAVTSEELDSIAENDVNNYFQLCVELFDYMDDILNLQAAVFDSLGNARANSMTASGQCRLAALIPCAQDSSHIYDCNVRLLFRLHAALPPDVLAGHRERFRQQFKKLSAFYKHASAMQYFRNLLSLPQLPNNPPNFLLQSDFGTYVTPVVRIPDPEPEPDQDLVGSLIDTSDTMSQMTSPDMDLVDSRATPSPQPELVAQRDQLIAQLQEELGRQRAELAGAARERGSMLLSMRDHCSRLEAQLADAQKELEQEKQRAELLSSQTPEITQKLNEVEERARLTDDKFQKLKTAYTQLRAEHISLIRQKAEVDKLTASLKVAVAEHESVKSALQLQLDDRMRDVEVLQQSASASESVNNEIETLRNEIITLQSELAKSREKKKELVDIKASIEETQNLHKMKSTEAQERIEQIEEQTKRLLEELEKTKQEKTEIESSLGKLREEVVVLKDASKEELSKVLEEKEVAFKQVEELTLQFEKEKQETEMQLDLLKSQQDEFNIREKDYLEEIASLKTDLSLKIENYENIMKSQENQILDQNEKYETCQSNLASTTDELNNLKEIIDKIKKEQGHVSETMTIEMKEKEESIASLQFALDKHNEEINIYKNEVEEKEAELEITKNELILLKTEHEAYITKAEENITNGCELLKKFENELQHVASDKDSLLSQISKCNDILSQKEQEYTEKISNLQTSLKIVQQKHDTIKVQYEEKIAEMSEEMSTVSKQILDIQHQKEEEIERLKKQLHNDMIKQNTVNKLLEENLLEKQSEIDTLTNEIQKVTKGMEESLANNSVLVHQYEETKKALAGKLEHSEQKRLTAECELQDLLQHNSSLEENLSTVKSQLVQAQEEIEKYKAALVSTAAETGAELVERALRDLERDGGAAAAEVALGALDQLVCNGGEQREGSEPETAKSAVRAAHHTAQLATHTCNLLATVTDNELVDSVTNETRAMLNLTKQCMEELARGEHANTRAHANEARSRVKTIAARTAAAAARGTTRSVDDELADMDCAIEEAANRIEAMLAASRAADSGVKLEVNSKILDACTTLMGAVRMLVRDARKLQTELGDPTTRQKMYRRNPQWSEGLISAAKAVVVAAELLVTSADEAVSGSGAMEGVSAASHEVAGSTAQLVAASRARAPPASAALAQLTQASRSVAAATGAVVAAVRAAAALTRDQADLETSALTLTATRRLEMESKVRSLELETALDAERARLAALRRRHYQLAQLEENGNMTNGKH